MTARPGGSGAAPPGGARFVMERSAPPVDEPVALRVVGVGPGQQVTIRARCVDERGAIYGSWAAYQAGDDGAVDPARQAPRAGSYEGVDPFGLWWSMTSDPDRPFARGLRAVPTTVSAEVAGEVVARVHFERPRVGDGVSVRVARQGDLHATLFAPAACPAPGVLVLGGSEGGRAQAEEVAALLATRGFAALAVAYFGAPGLGAQMVEIPVERVEAAARWLIERPEVDGAGLAAVGTSRGAELALLFASRSRDVRAVVGFSASAIHWVGFAPAAAPPRAAWTRDGAALPFAVPLAAPSSPEVGSGPRAPVALEEAFLRGLRDERRVAEAEIPVEQIRGPLLLVSGGADGMWPSRLFGELALRRRAALGAHLADVHLTYAGAGHGLWRVPGLPAPSTSTAPQTDGTSYALGGSRGANARAAQDAWPRVLAFLAEHLRRPPASPDEVAPSSALRSREGR